MWWISMNNLGIAWISKNLGMWPSCEWRTDTKLLTFGPCLSCSVSLVNSHSRWEWHGNVGLCFPEVELAKWSHWAGIAMTENRYCTLNGMALMEGRWCVTADPVVSMYGDLVHRECFRGVSWSSSLAELESSFGSVLGSSGSCWWDHAEHP